MRTTNLVLEREHPVGDGVQKIYRFDNGLGASVIRNTYNGIPFSYGASEGLWELGVVKFNEDHVDENPSFSLTYETPITDDVLGYLTEEDVDRTLAEIEALEA